MNRIAYKSVQKLNISTACAATYTFYIHVSVAWYFKFILKFRSHYLHLWQQVNKDEFDFLFNKSNLQLACNYPPFLENKT